MAFRDGEEKIVQDRYWRVPVLMGCATYLLIMPYSSFGLFYVFFMEKFGVSREDASWPQSTCSLVTHLSGLIVFVLQRYMKTYHIVHLSCVITVLALITSAFAPTIFWMSVTFGVIHGFGHGLFLTSGSIYILLFFDKYRSMASSLMFASWGLSSIVSQFVVTRLVDDYGLGGAMLVFGAILMHSTPIVMLAKSPSAVVVTFQQCAPAENECVTPDSEGTASYGTVKECNKPEELSIAPEAQKSKVRQGAYIKQALTLFSPPAFYVLLITIIVGDYMCTEVLKTMVDYGVDKGIELSTAKQLITFSSVGQLLGRTAFPVLADLLPPCRYHLYALNFLVHGAVMVAIPHVFDYQALAALAAVVGASQGYILCMKYVMIALYLGVDRTAACCGLVGLAMIPLCSFSPRIVGLFRDARGSYDQFYRMLGAISFASCVVFFTFHVWNVVQKKIADSKKPCEDHASEPT